MNRKLGSIAFLVLVVTMAVVLVLVTRSWSSLAPTVDEIRSVQQGAPAAPSGVTNTQQRDLPRMSDMKQATDEHSDGVQEALAAID
jgi:hypothetical protein